MTSQRVWQAVLIGMVLISTGMVAMTIFGGPAARPLFFECPEGAPPYG